MSCKIFTFIFVHKGVTMYIKIHQCIYFCTISIWWVWYICMHRKLLLLSPELLFCFDHLKYSIIIFGGCFIYIKIWESSRIIMIGEIRVHTLSQKSARVFLKAFMVQLYQLFSNFQIESKWQLFHFDVNFNHVCIWSFWFFLLKRFSINMNVL